jgi:hypothetical protein
VDNNETDLREIELGGMDRIKQVENRDCWRIVENKVMNLRFPYSAGNFLSICTTGGHSRRAQLNGVIHTKTSNIFYDTVIQFVLEWMIKEKHKSNHTT